MCNQSVHDSVHALLRKSTYRQISLVGQRTMYGNQLIQMQEHKPHIQSN